MRASARGFGWARLWPALENLSGRKPRGPGIVYGESAVPVGSVAISGALLGRLNGLRAVASPFHRSVCFGFNPGCWRFADFTRLSGSLRTKGFDRFGRANRSAMDGMNGHSVMRPVPLVERGIGGITPGPGATARSSETSSTLSTDGSLRSSVRNCIYFFISSRPQVIEKKKRRAVMRAL